jgi:UDP-3-O-[3-hydroxymyristoyl] glucosamine N-acyltransferase
MRSDSRVIGHGAEISRNAVEKYRSVEIGSSVVAGSGTVIDNNVGEK